MKEKTMLDENNKFRYVSFKKLLIFGIPLTGKTLLAKSFDEIESDKKINIETEEGKNILY